MGPSLDSTFRGSSAMKYQLFAELRHTEVSLSPSTQAPHGGTRVSQLLQTVVAGQNETCEYVIE